MMDTAEAFARISKHLDASPVVMMDVAKAIELEVEIVPLPEELNSILRRHPGGYLLLINKHRTRDRQRWAIARGVVLALLCGHAVRGDLRDSKDSTTSFGPVIDAMVSRIAMGIIMPEPLVRALWSGGDQDAHAISRLMEVSEKAARQRLEAIGLIRP